LKKTTKFVAVLAAATLAFGFSAPAANAAGTKACLALDTGGVDDKSFNASSWAGAQAAAKANSAIKVEYLPANSSADFKVNIKKFVDNKCDLIIGVGFAISSAIVESAKANPKVKYAVVDDAEDGSQVSQVRSTQTLRELPTQQIRQHLWLATLQQALQRLARLQHTVELHTQQ
jgi:basic membrane protein A and related proteins